TEDVFADGNQVVCRWTFRGTHGGAFGGVEATGKEVSVPGAIGVLRVEGGKISEGHFAWDKYSLMQQLGALPTAGA
ncbi:MAG: ester cyclase, partial [Longimicrobiales bacterium]